MCGGVGERERERERERESKLTFRDVRASFKSAIDPSFNYQQRAANSLSEDST